MPPPKQQAAAVKQQQQQQQNWQAFARSGTPVKKNDESLWRPRAPTGTQSTNQHINQHTQPINQQLIQPTNQQLNGQPTDTDSGTKKTWDNY